MTQIFPLDGLNRLSNIFDQTSIFSIHQKLAGNKL